MNTHQFGHNTTIYVCLMCVEHAMPPWTPCQGGPFKLTSVLHGLTRLISVQHPPLHYYNMRACAHREMSAESAREVRHTLDAQGSASARGGASQ
jgi:hypothetical protein